MTLIMTIMKTNTDKKKGTVILTAEKNMQKRKEVKTNKKNVEKKNSSTYSYSVIHSVIV